MPLWFRWLLFVLALVIIAGVFVLVYFSCRMHIFRVKFDFSLIVEIVEEQKFKIPLPGPIPDIKIPVSYKETFSFQKTTSTKYTALSAIRELRNTTEGYGDSNLALYYIGIITIYYLTLARISLFFIVWVVPLPKLCHRLL